MTAPSKDEDEDVVDIMLTMGIVKVEQKKSPNSKALLGILNIMSGWGSEGKLDGEIHIHNIRKLVRMKFMMLTIVVVKLVLKTK